MPRQAMLASLCRGLGEAGNIYCRMAVPFADNYSNKFKLVDLLLALTVWVLVCASQNDAPTPDPSSSPLHKRRPMTLYHPHVLLEALNTGGFHCILAGSILLLGFSFSFSLSALCLSIRTVGTISLCSPLW